MWLAALAGRVSFVVHRCCGHTVTWKTSPPDLPLCPGDILCRDCGQVLWCRAHDPWRAWGEGRRESPADHWGGTRPPQPPTTLFEGLQDMLRLAGECPSGPTGDDIRRATCELIEANSAAAQNMGRRRILKAIARIEWRRSRGRSRGDDPSPMMLTRLTEAIRREVRPG